MTDKKKLILTNKYKITKISASIINLHSIDRSYLRIRDYIKNPQPGDIVIEKIYLMPDGKVEIKYEREENAESNN